MASASIKVNLKNPCEKGEQNTLVSCWEAGECGAATQKVHLVQEWGGVRGWRTSTRFRLYSVQLLFWSRQGVSSEHMTTGLPS